jgi:hypothetical protein
MYTHVPTIPALGPVLIPAGCLAPRSQLGNSQASYRKKH